MLAAFDKFWIIIAIVIGSAIVDWLKRRGQKAEADTSDDQSQAPRPSPPLHRPAPPPLTQSSIPTSSWEEELRRLLSGQTPTTKPPPAAPAPVRPVIVSAPVASPPAVAKRSPTPPPVRVIRPHIEEATEAPAVSLAKLEESAGAYQRASQLHEAVGEHLRQVDAMTERHVATMPLTRRHGISPDVANFVSLLRRPNTARQAIVASMILGPPKALEAE